jgi:hypothetical protein
MLSLQMPLVGRFKVSHTYFDNYAKFPLLTIRERVASGFVAGKRGGGAFHSSPALKKDFWPKYVKI